VSQHDVRTLPPSPVRRRIRPRLPGWRREALRTTLWLVPAVLVVLVAALFVITYQLDQAVYHGRLTLPSWIRTESADAGRQVLIGIAAAVITVVGVVFSITILALTLASQQFGPRMLRNFVRDLGTQFTLGVFVATFVFALLALGSITNGRRGEFVPAISITVALVLVLGDLIVLIYFIHHVAKSIQLPEVIAGIAEDLSRAIDDEFPLPATTAVDVASDDSVPVLLDHLDAKGVAVLATDSGYLQFVGYRQLVAIAQQADAVIRLAHRTGHFVMAGSPLATVWPPEAAPTVARALARAHVTGPHRTLLQDPVFAIDQLVEIAIRAISPAVNDPFTALTCIDWLADGLGKISGRLLVRGVYRDQEGGVRLIEFGPSYARMVDRAFDKIRQSGRGMPPVVIRQVDAIARIMEYTVTADQRQVLLRQADMLLRASEEAIPDPEDRAVVLGRYQQVIATMARLEAVMVPSGSSLGAPGPWRTTG
jgi:uncharacterized membrane protein